MSYIYRAIDRFRMNKEERRNSPATKLFSDSERERAEKYFWQKATKEVQHFCKPAEYKDSTLKDGVLLYNARVLVDPSKDSLEQSMLDITPDKFCRPLVDRYSPLAYAIIQQVHVELSHRGVIPVLARSREIAFILGAKNLATEIREKCPFCTRFKQRLLKSKLAPLDEKRVRIAPPFWHCNCDIAGPWTSYSVNKRASMKVFALVIVCSFTKAISLHVMEGYSTRALTDAYMRHVAKHSHVKRITIDHGSQLVKFCTEMKVSILDWEASMNCEEQGIEVVITPTQAHHYNAIAERSIRDFKKLLNTCFSGIKMSPLDYETAFAWVSRSMNNMPIARTSEYKNLETQDLLTPARILYGRNSDRSIDGPVRISLPSKMESQQQQIHESWIKAWKESRLIDFIPQPSTKWTKDGYTPQVNDLCVFPREDNCLTQPHWRLGQITQVHPGKADGKIRAVTIQYRNHDIIIRQVIADVEHQLRHPTERGIEHLAWSIDAAKFRDYSGPAQCNCDSKYELAELLTRLYHEAPVNLCVSAMWACPSDWDAPMPKY